MIQCFAGMIAGIMAAGTIWDGSLQTEGALAHPIGQFAFKTPPRAGLSELSSTPSSKTADSLASNAVAVQIEVEPQWPGWKGLSLICPTDRYHGESSARSRDGGLRMAISGTIRSIDRKKSLISYDLEIRFQDKAGLTRLSAAGSGLFVHGQPTTIITMAGRKVIMTASVLEQSNEGDR